MDFMEHFPDMLQSLMSTRKRATGRFLAARGYCNVMNSPLSLWMTATPTPT
jgi:hypothetical protein